MATHYISSEHLDIETAETIVSTDTNLALSKEAKEKIIRCRKYLDQKLKSSNEPVYGINTGFGALHNTSISEKDLDKLQYNLVKSHACGTGDEVPAEIVRLMLLLKVQGLAYGNSG